jgi:hypothetical protein
MQGCSMLERFRPFLALLLRILALHANGALLFLFQVANEIGIVRILDRPTRLCHLACRSALL